MNNQSANRLATAIFSLVDALGETNSAIHRFFNHSPTVGKEGPGNGPGGGSR